MWIVFCIQKMQEAVALGIQQRKSNWTEQRWVQPRCFKNVWAVKTHLQCYAYKHRCTSIQKLDQTAALCRCQDIAPKQRGTSSYSRKSPDKLRRASHTHDGRGRKAFPCNFSARKGFLLGHAADCRPTLAVCAYGLFLRVLLESLAKHSTDWVPLENSSLTDIQNAQ